MSNLTVLITACDALKDLKYKEGMYKRAALITASDSLSNLKSKGLVKSASPTLALLALTGLGLGAYHVGKNGMKDVDNIRLGLNKLNNNWGQGAVIREANRGNMTPAERDRFLIARLGTNADYNRLRDIADNDLRARRYYTRRRYNRYSALNRGTNIINDARYNSSRGYYGAMAGQPGYTYGPYTNSFSPYGLYY